jgi:hypothetical protein
MVRDGFGFQLVFVDSAPRAAARCEEGDDRLNASVVVAAPVQLEFVENVVDMFLDCALGQPEPPGDAGVGATLRHQLQHVVFSLG